MNIFNTIFNSIFDILLYPITIISPVIGLIIVSIIVGIFMLFLFKHVSNQEGIKRQKDYLKATLLELRLYKDDVRLSLAAIKNLLFINLRYLKFSVKPMLVLMVPTVIILIQLASWYEFRPLKVGESTILSVVLKENSNLNNIELIIPEGILVETPPLRILQNKQIDWRIKATRSGDWQIKFQKNSQICSKNIQVGIDFHKLSPYRISNNSLVGFLYPTEIPLPKNSFIKEITFNYPHRELSVLGFKTHWLIIFLGVSIIVGYSMKGVFKVQV